MQHTHTYSDTFNEFFLKCLFKRAENNKFFNKLYIRCQRQRACLLSDNHFQNSTNKQYK